MAKFIYIRTRDSENPLLESLRKNEKVFNEQLIPSEIDSKPCMRIRGNGYSGLVLNPGGYEQKTKSSLCTGVLFEEDGSWDIPGTKHPDGNYVIVRSNSDVTEVLSDFQATHSVWYYHDQEKFLISSSQQAIIMLLGNLQFSDQATAWMISSGTLGPKHSWDERVSMMGPDSRLKLGHDTWDVQYIEEPINFRPSKGSKYYHVHAYVKATEMVVRKLPPSLRYAQQLTGGYDSRLILLSIIEAGKSIAKFFTLGIRKAAQIKYSDADIASRLANMHGLDWEYVETDFNEVDFELLFDEFLKVGEGRLDNLERLQFGRQYIADLFKEGIQVIIGGSDGFRTQKHRKTEQYIQLQKRLIRISDISNLPQGIKTSFPQQVIPNELKMREGETYIEYYHRVSQQFFGPCADSALHEFLLPFMTIVNPLQSRSVLQVMRSMPDRYREGKQAIKKYIQRVGWNIPFDRSVSINRTPLLLEQKVLFEYLLNEVKRLDPSGQLLPKPFFNFLIKVSTKPKTGQHGLKQILKRWIPSKTWRLISLFRRNISLALKKTAPETISVPKRVLILRSFIVLKMYERLERAANLILPIYHEPTASGSEEMP